MGKNKQTVEEKKRAPNDYINNNMEHAMKAFSNQELFKLSETNSKYYKKELKNRQKR